MGISASLFFSSNDSEKQTLHKRITPSDEQFEEQQERWNLIAGHLMSDLKERSGYNIRTWLQGSYKFATQIRPVHKGEEFDIDLGVYFCWKGQCEDGDYRPKELKSMVQESLEQYCRDTDGAISVDDPPKPRCARIRFEGNFHIDVPCYHLDELRDARKLAIEQDEWEDSDPKAIHVWFIQFLDEHPRAKVRRIIRYLKTWAALKFRAAGRPSSILLTVLAAEAAAELSADELASDDEALLAVLNAIRDRLLFDEVVKNPVNPNEEISSRLTSEELDTFIERLVEFGNNAADAFAADTVVEAAELWSNPFEHLFPMPDESEAIKGMDYLPVLATTPEVRVHAIARQDKKRRWQGDNGIGPIPKDCDITFTIINSDAVPPGASVHWMVRNEGTEAEYVNDLGHIAGSGLTATEHSAYNGTHYMDCMIKRSGRVLGFRRVPVNIRGNAIVRRNPLRRPNYVRLLKGRR